MQEVAESSIGLLSHCPGVELKGREIEIMKYFILTFFHEFSETQLWL